MENVAKSIPKFYVAANGTKRKWRYEDWERPNWAVSNGKTATAGCSVCYDCRLLYKDMVDICLSNEKWELINPTYHKGAGILCANCIFERLHKLGIYKVLVK
jgi:hypothetical protein